MRATRRSFLALPLAAACSAAGDRSARLFVAPDGEGDGMSWESAASLLWLDDLLNRLAPGGEVLIAADRGPYSVADAIEVGSGGRANAAKRVRGVDSASGEPGMALLRGVRNDEGEASDCFRLLRGADHLHFSHLAFEQIGNGCVRVGAPLRDLTVEDCSFDDVYRFFENTASRGERQASLTGFSIRRCSGQRARRGFARIRYASRNGQIEDCAASGLANEGGYIPAGIALDDTAHAIIMRRCVMGGFQQWRASNYWNGDGFSDEVGNYDIIYEACEAHGSTDGGFDCKSRDVVLKDCVAADNKRNFRFWSERATLTGCISRDPNFRGAGEENASACHIWIGHEAARVRIDNLTIADAGEPEAIFEFEYDDARAEIHGVTINAESENWGDDADRVLNAMIVSR